MKTAATNCFTYQQLSHFADNKMPSQEKLLFIQHTHHCELCRFALWGFERIPFSESDLSDIEIRIDHRIKTKNTGSFKYALLGLASVLSIVAFYCFANSFARNPEIIPSPYTPLPLLPNTENPHLHVAVYEPKKVEKAGVRPSANVRDIKPELYVPSVLNPITPTVNVTHSDTTVYAPPVFGNNDVFIHHLKVAGYWELYFKAKRKETVKFSNHLPPAKENRGTLIRQDDDKEFSEPLVLILDNALLNFSQEKYRSAIAEFQKLLAYSPGDVNASFYLAMAYYKTGKLGLAERNFNKVLKHSDKTFAEEAKWHLALVYIEADEPGKAKPLLEEIIAGNGFYAKNAKKELAGIHK
jgi:hypothetical protein